MSQALYRKWRPQNWDAVIGQQHIVNTLRNALASGRIAHAYLFAGPRGTGKTTTARLLAKAVNCLEDNLALRPCGKCDHCQAVNQGRFLDLIEIDAASNTSVEDVRDLRDKINFSPNQGRYKVYIVDEVHMLSTAAFNALLKTLEEPPPHAIFVLATTEVHKIPSTVLSRCQRHEFRRIPVVDIVECLTEITQGEGIQFETEALTLIARQSTGAMRDAISLLDQLSSTGQTVTLEMAQNVLGTATSQAVLEVVEALIARQADVGLNHIHAALDKGSDPRQFARQVVDYLRDLLLIRLENASQIDAPTELRSQMVHHTQALSTSELLCVIRIFNTAANESRGSWQPSLPLELALVESLETLKQENMTSGDSQVSPIAHFSVSPARTSRSVPTEAVKPAEDKPATGVDVQLSPSDGQADQILSESWGQILALVRQRNPRAYGLMNSCRSRNMHGDLLILNFATNVLKAQMEKPENLDIACQALTQTFQRKITIRCNVDAARREAIPPGVEDDGMVAAVLRDLGGEIADID